MKLKDKVAIVTGGAIGIGRAMAEGLASEGASIVIADMANADVAAKEMQAKGFKAIGVKTDVSSEKDTEKMAEEALNAFQGIDILINNAGVYTSLIPGPFEKISVEEWRRVMDVNLLGMFLCSKAVVGAMRKNKSGRIINLSSGTPFKGIPFLLHYVTSKGGVIALTRALAKELGADNILVNAIAPGFTLSDGVMSNEVQLKHFREISAKVRTLMRDQHPEDLVGAVKFFAGPDSSFITGQTLVVDGGAYFH
ncbi:MAG: 3-oxoacyl-ACP reductase FabG [Deltaproteobacteria bacterium]|nr:3-oxoacyl-ACP reductase FabG [Deltaproteobacteria bacterium]